jgi:hypothetical protein
MRRISADRGMTFGLKHRSRQIARDSGARDNEDARDNAEEVIGTQLRFGMGDCHTRWLASLEDANRIASVWFQQY